MNILPKKKWHVRTTENIERVRRDEAKAAEEERELVRRQKLAEQEARTNLLRSKARQRLGHIDSEDQIKNDNEKESTNDQKALVGFDGGGGEVVSITGSGGHVNFFQNLEDGEKLAKTNDEHEAEKKREQEEYEKKIGYLTYLGQDTEELTGEKVWYRKPPTKYNQEDNDDADRKIKDVDSKFKNFIDPMQSIKRHLGCEDDKLTFKRHSQKTEVSLKRKRSRSPSESKKRKKRKKDKKKKSKKSKKSDSSSSRKKKRKRTRSSSSDDDSSSSSSEEERKKKTSANLAKLRKERLDREKKERRKANRLLNPEAVNIFPEKKEAEEEDKKVPSMRQSYNSQFNPTIARQNKLDPKEKYWLH